MQNIILMLIFSNQLASCITWEQVCIRERDTKLFQVCGYPSFLWMVRMRKNSEHGVLPKSKSVGALRQSHVNKSGQKS